MADIRKDQERDELHRAIWAIADGLRGSVDGWDFKSYVLGMMFYRYISENLTNYINEGEIEAGNEGFDYALLSDEDAEQAREDMVKTKGFFILPSELFCNLRKKAAGDENLNMTLETIFKNIEDSAKGSESEDNFAGLFDDIDVNSNKLGATVAKRNANLVKLIEGVADMKLGNYKENSIDAFGDAYEYLMGMYASNAGKSGGEFFTPQEVSELLTRIAVVGKTEVNKVYDPACGSGSLLLKAAKILGKDKVRQGFFGQEINLTTYNLCRINMFLHDIDYDKFDIAHEDTLMNPQHWDDEPFEVIVSNPPYSIKWEGDDNPVLINDPRFSPAGVLAPKSKADLAFIMHSLAWLATNGTAAIVCFPGIMYRGGAEKKIRQYLIDNNFIDCIIQLPSNLFFGTSIATCIMVLKRSKADNSTLFIDASNECVKVTNNNKLTDGPDGNIEHIVPVETEDKFTEWLAKAEIAHKERLGAGAIIYLRSILERITIEVGDSAGVEIRKRSGSMKPFDQVIAAVDKNHIFRYRQLLLDQRQSVPARCEYPAVPPSVQHCPSLLPVLSIRRTVLEHHPARQNGLSLEEFVVEGVSIKDSKISEAIEEAQKDRAVNIIKGITEQDKMAHDVALAQASNPGMSGQASQIMTGVAAGAAMAPVMGHMVRNVMQPTEQFGQGTQQHRDQFSIGVVNKRTAPIEENKAICPQCGATVTENSRFCNQCGAQLEKESEPPETCPLCGGQIPKGSKFCNHCGGKL